MNAHMTDLERFQQDRELLAAAIRKARSACLNASPTVGPILAIGADITARYIADALARGTAFDRERFLRDAGAG